MRAETTLANNYNSMTLLLKACHYSATNECVSHNHSKLHSKSENEHNSSATMKAFPNLENVQWDTEGLLDRRHNWPSEQKVNWTELGREFNIPGKNKGQVVKELPRSMELMSFSSTIDLLAHG